MISQRVQKDINRSILAVIFCINIINLCICCEEPYFNCRNAEGDCIPYEKMCDGKIDCYDKSDETAQNCIQQNCPPLSFRCAYGACVPNTAPCNGTMECADNSDETPALCSPSIRDNSICKPEEFMCNQVQCIPQEQACDGRIDCLDRSDETIEACASNVCDMFFRCGYGACIRNDQKCDGVPDCADGSDEASTLCTGILPKTSLIVVIPPITTPPPPTSSTALSTISSATSNSCTIPNIKHSRIMLENNTVKMFTAGENVPDLTFIKYHCERGFFREGTELNFCSNGKWFTTNHPICIRYCPYEVLQGVTFNVKCIKDKVAYKCNDRIRPGTVAIVTCSTKYRISDHNPVQRLYCTEENNYEWDYQPSRCEPVCGEELIPSVPFLTNADTANITTVPWHVGVYIKDNKGKYSHHCGGTIISAKIVISAAHCFWDRKNGRANENSLYSLGAGKNFRDFYKDESRSQIRNISQIAIPEAYKGEDAKYAADIAVVIVVNPFIFSEFISPICIDWKDTGAKVIPNGLFGKVAGWGKTEEGGYSEELKTISVTASSKEACRNDVDGRYRDSVTDDKFCILNKFAMNACQGDSGGGFAEVREINKKNRYFLWGVVSTGVPLDLTCSNYQFVTYTNIQFFEEFINDLEIRNRVK